MHHAKDGVIDTSDGTYCVSFDDAVSYSNYEFGAVTFSNHRNVEVSGLVLVNNAINLVAMSGNYKCSPGSSCYRQPFNVKVHDVIMAAN